MTEHTRNRRPMTEHTRNRRPMRLLALPLVAIWAVTAVAIAAAYRPGGPIDIVVVLACFLPVLVSVAGLAWPPEAASQRDGTALVWIWIVAMLFAVPVLYGVTSSLAAGGPQILVPSAEAAYAGLVALFLLSCFSVIGLIHARRGTLAFDRAATMRTAALSVLLTVVVAAAFGMVAFINDQALHPDEAITSRFGPTDPDLVPPLCHEPLLLGNNAAITITATSSEDNTPRGRATLEGRRNGIDEVWGGSWQGPDGNGQAAYLRTGASAWLNRSSDDPEAPGTTWQAVKPGLFEMAGARRLTMDGPPLAVVGRPRGSIVAEDLGLEVVEGARARHCRTFIDGATALATYLPLRWLVSDEVAEDQSQLSDWRGKLDWWVFADGELGLARVEISGLRSQAGWDSDGVRGVLEAHLEATDRSLAVDVTAGISTSAAAPQAPPASVPPDGAERSNAAESPSAGIPSRSAVPSDAAAAAALESGAP